MDLIARLPRELAVALERGATVVTANQRAARALRRAYDRFCRERELGSWRPPLIFAWETWTSGLWQQLILEGQETAVVLNRSQEHGVWRGIIGADAEVNALRNADSLAGMAAESWRLLCQYGGVERLRSFAGSTDTRAFQRWAQEFVRRCRAEEMLPAAELDEALVAALGRSALPLPGEIVLVGFDGFTPAQTRLVEFVRGRGVGVEEYARNVSSGVRVLVEAKDESAEIEATARWIRGYLLEHPGARVAVIVPNLGEQRARIDRVLREVLAPELQDISARSERTPYEFSLGVPLARTPMIADALRLLRWAAEPLPLSEVSRLLLSPYFAADEKERVARAEFDAFVLREESLLRPEMSVGGLRETIENWPRNGRISRLLIAVKRVQRIVAERFGDDEQRPYGEWADTIRALLEEGAWGSGGGEDSVEFQTRRKWEGALDELTTLDVRPGKVGFREALRRLRWIAEQTMFAAESLDAPVQVMGPLEAAGSWFDALWLLGAGEETWPGTPRRSPLLPWQLQRELGMPGADPERDDAQSRSVTRRLAESAGMAVFSFAVETAHGHQRRSYAVEGLGLEEVALEEFVPSVESRMPVDLETVADDADLPALPDEVVRGGAEVLRLQAACGFRAFAEKRLWSSELNQTEMGLDARMKGVIVHRALEGFWNAVQSQQALKAMPQAELNAEIERAIDEALRGVEELCVTEWDTSYVEVQRTRLRNLMHQWLALEKRRRPFTVKMSEKRFSDVRIGPLRLDVQVDRIDTGEEGEILIDYKTGVARPSEWLTERPDAPQLPLYAAVSEAEKLEAVAFAQVRTGKEMTLTGFASRSEALIRPVKLTEAPTLEAQVERWRDVLVALANDFSSGDVRVRPKKYPETCSYCAQRILCRLNPADFEDDNEEDEMEA